MNTTQFVMAGVLATSIVFAVVILVVTRKR